MHQSFQHCPYPPPQIFTFFDDELANTPHSLSLCPYTSHVRWLAYGSNTKQQILQVKLARPSVHWGTLIHEEHEQMRHFSWGEGGVGTSWIDWCVTLIITTFSLYVCISKEDPCLKSCLKEKSLFTRKMAIHIHWWFFHLLCLYFFYPCNFSTAVSLTQGKIVPINSFRALILNYWRAIGKKFC